MEVSFCGHTNTCSRALIDPLKETRVVRSPFAKRGS
jgi:hypothetical protein